MNMNVRFISTENCGLCVREAGEGEQQSRTVKGKPILFGVRSVNLTPWSDMREVYEVLEPGCLTDELISRSDVVLNINHSNKVTDVLGRSRNRKGTLTIALNTDSVDVDCDLPHTNNANDTLELIKRGDITGMSFAFTDDWEDSENGVSYEHMHEEDHDGKEVWVRHVKKITGLYDVSIVTHPAYDQTSVGTREAGDAIEKAINAQIEREKPASPSTGSGTAEGEQREEAPAGPSTGSGTAEGEKPDAPAETDEERQAREQKEQQEREQKEQQEREKQERAMLTARHLRKLHRTLNCNKIRKH